MSELVFKAMKGIEPVLDACLQDSAVADIAHNVKLWHGRLDPWRTPKLCEFALGLCAAHVRDCCWRGTDDHCMRFVDVLCGPTILSSPTTLPSVINNWCDPDEKPCPLGFPCGEAPHVQQLSDSPECHMSDVRAYLITYGDECVYGGPSEMSNVFFCANKDDKFRITLPQPPAHYCNVTKIRIYRLMSTLSVEEAHNHRSREHRAQGFSAPQAAEAHCFEVGCVDVGTTTFEDCGGVEEQGICDSVISEGWEEPPCGMIVHGMFDSGALVASHGDRLLFSEFNTHHAWPCKYEITMDCPIVEVCVCDNFAFVFTTGGVSIVEDTVEALENYCRPKKDIKRAMPLCHHKGVVCTEGQAVFATKTGLYRIDRTGALQNLTERMGSDNWCEMDPGSMRLGLYEHRLMITSDRFSGVYDINLFGDGSPASNTLSTIDVCPSCWINDKQGNLFFVGPEGISQWDAGDAFMDMHWRSQEREYPGFNFLSAMQIHHTTPRGSKVANTACPTYVSVYADGCKVYERPVNHNEPVRLPRCCAQSFAVEVQGRRSVSVATLAASKRCIGQVA